MVTADATNRDRSFLAAIFSPIFVGKKPINRWSFFFFFGKKPLAAQLLQERISAKKTR